ncbi:thioesterase family protein [Aliikangiella sp. IMCC44359]|uniref:thioesterase family protein n=1 Tax=Aliikangiella sp. IMCC44359 TaxID=3459125 RepID=UPI00403AA166
MNLYFRLIFTLLRNFYSKQLHPLVPVKSNFRVMPWDLDAFGHMNNGRYLQISDVARVDWMSKANILNALLKNRWGAVLGGNLIRYEQALNIFQKYTVKTTVDCWDERWFYIRHIFISTSGKTVAKCLTKAALVGKQGWVGTQPIIDQVVPGLESPQMPIDFRNWLMAESLIDHTPPFERLKSI